MADRYFAELSSPQVAAVLAAERTPVLLLPLGAVEPHGPHGPLATDGIISRGMCERAVELLDGDPGVRALILPELPYGVTRFAAGFAGALSVSPETLHALLVDVCGALLDNGFRHVVLVNNHFEPAHLETLRRAVDTLRAERGARIGHLDLVRRRNAERLTEEFRSGECHAGRYETSLVLADRPELVDTPTMRALPRVPVDLPGAMRAGRRDFRAMGLDRAYCGSPAESSAEEGEQTFGTLATMLVELIRELAGGGRG